MGEINKFARHQPQFKYHDYLPTRSDGTCSCGCGVELTGRKTRWASKGCMDKSYHEYAIIKGNVSIIRMYLFEIKKGFCESCGQNCKDIEWEADHILPVYKGGGGCDITGFQLLCIDCHKEKTKQDLKRPEPTSPIASARQLTLFC